MITEGQFSEVLRKNICCGYSLESLWLGDSNEYPQHMSLRRNNKNYPSIIIKYPPSTWAISVGQHLMQQNMRSNKCLPL